MPAEDHWLTILTDWMTDWLPCYPRTQRAGFVRAYRLVDLYTKSFTESEDPYRSSRHPSSYLVLAPRAPSFSFAPISCPKPAARHVFRSLLDPGEPSGNLANTDVSDVYMRRTTNYSTSFHVALTFHPPAITSLYPSSFAFPRILFRLLGEASGLFHFAFTRNS